MIKLFIDRGIFGNYFEVVIEILIVGCIDCDNILRRCIFVFFIEDEVCGYLSFVLRYY